MRLSKVWSDVRRTLDLVLHALDNNITAQENLGPTGAPAGNVLTSVAPNKIPEWLPPIVVAAAPGSTATGSSGSGVVVVAGPPGPPGAAGTDCDCDALGHFEPMSFDSELVFDSDGDVILVWVNA